MKLDPLALQQLSAATLAHYDQRADDFWRGTRDHDVSANIAALLQYIEGSSPFTIMDLGCGPGRDLKTFADLGHVAVGVEGAARFVEMARTHSGCDVWQQDFLKLDFRKTISTAYSPTPRCFMCPAKNSRAYYEN